jgi:hypothetical protein
VNQPLLVLLLPERLEQFHLEQPVRDLLQADGVVAVDPSRMPLARMLPSVAARAAMGQARRMRLPGTPRAVAVFDPAQYFLAGALLARNPGSELWYARSQGEEVDPAIDAEMADRAALTMTPEQLLAIAPLRMAELGIATGSSG